MKEISASEFKNFQSSKMNTDHLNYEIEKSGFTLIGTAVFNDELRPGVPTSVVLCHNAFIKVIMITGDYSKNGRSYKKNEGNINPSEKYCSMNGKDFIDSIGGIVWKTCIMETNKYNCPKIMGQAKMKFGENMNKEYLSNRIKKEKVHDIKAFKEILNDLRVIANEKRYR